MFPRLLDFGNFGIPTYGLMAALGLVLGLTLIVQLARREGIDTDRVWNLGILAVLSGILGAKLLYVLHNWDFYAQHPRALFSVATVQAAGVWYGGLLGAIAACAWYMRRHGMPGLLTADIFAPGVALAHAIGRLGCFAAGCCYGRLTDVPWAVTFTHPLAFELVGTPLYVPLHPTQLYEFAVEFMLFFALLWMVRRRAFNGQIIGSYLFLYGFARYFLEFLRGDPDRGSVLGIMSGTQFISILLVIAGGTLWMRLFPGQRSAPVRVANAR